MMYKSKIENLLESLDSKLKVISNICNGSMQVSMQDLNNIINDCNRIRTQISELISIER